MVKKLLGDAVREERLRRNLSQNSLAEQAKISLRTVSDIENYIGNQCCSHYISSHNKSWHKKFLLTPARFFYSSVMISLLNFPCTR